MLSSSNIKGSWKKKEKKTLSDKSSITGRNLQKTIKVLSSCPSWYFFLYSKNQISTWFLDLNIMIQIAFVRFVHAWGWTSVCRKYWFEGYRPNFSGGTNNVLQTAAKRLVISPMSGNSATLKIGFADQRKQNFVGSLF